MLVGRRYRGEDPQQLPGVPVRGLGHRAQGLGLRVQGSGFKV